MNRILNKDIIRNIIHIIRTYNFRQVIPNIRAYGIKTFLKNALREISQESDAEIVPEDAASSEKKNKQGRLDSGENYFQYLFSMNNKSDEDYVSLSFPNLAGSDIKLIAFYLPQFHPIPENDACWGKGFTEWTNVSKALPQFIGHYQPRLPGELGFYDLRLKEIQMRQAELAKNYGIYGFCFHFYWFNGRRVLERPLEQYLENKDIDFPFCINWANESWSRRWDGYDKDILLHQNHCPEDDINFIKYVSTLFEDSRYIRIDGKPLLIIYRPALFPNVSETAQRWREYCRNNNIGEIYLALTHSFEHIDPLKVGFDAAIEFPPNTIPLKEGNNTIDFINHSFKGIVYDYKDSVEFSKNYHPLDYKKFRGIFPSWDNEARKPGKGVIYHRASPERYRKWLYYLCDYTQRNFSKAERLIFVNAWNEWAEGAYLEPDRKYGYAYLTKTSEVLASFSNQPAAVTGNWKILFVSHDAHKGGAQSVLLNIISWFRKHSAINLKILCLNGGDLLDRFEALGDTLVLAELRKRRVPEDEIVEKINELCGGPPDLLYCNTAASGREYRLLRKLNAPIVTHFHELQMSIKRYAAEWLQDVFTYSSHIIACSRPVKDNLVKQHGVEPAKISTVHASINPDSSIHFSDDREKHQIRKQLGIDTRKFLVFGCGIGMAFRKGADLFIEAARILRRRGFDNFHFYWIGTFDAKESDDRYGLWTDHLGTLEKKGLKRYVTFLGLKDNPRAYLQAGDLFVLPSREDPFPLVALEAAECGLPIICFADAGGMPDFVGQDAGFAVPYEDVEAMAEKVAFLMADTGLRQKLGARAREKLLSRFTFDQAGPHILSVCRQAAQKKPSVSIIVPNYNHARYLPRRLDSIFNQTFRDFEVILLDDASTDDSVELLEKYSDIPDVRIIKNEHNTGSPFAQWLKGIDAAKADILWIAESDDACEPQFLETLIPAFRNPSVKLAYSDSFVIDENDRIVGDYTNCEYLTSLSEIKWKENYQAPSTKEINDGMGVKNTILNASAVLFRRFEFYDEWRKTFEGMRIAGDWYFIVLAIKRGDVYYVASKLNYHRRHSQSVIGKAVLDRKVEDFFREFHTVQQFIFSNYKLASDFYEKWERYLRKQWNDFYPGRSFEEIIHYYPLDKMKDAIKKNSELISVDTKAGDTDKITAEK